MHGINAAQIRSPTVKELDLCHPPNPTPQIAFNLQIDLFSTHMYYINVKEWDGNLSKLQYIHIYVDIHIHIYILPRSPLLCARIHPSFFCKSASWYFGNSLCTYKEFSSSAAFFALVDGDKTNGQHKLIYAMKRPLLPLSGRPRKHTHGPKR